jgi:3-dehydro-L-gulonate 2-dehydrogenase
LVVKIQKHYNKHFMMETSYITKDEMQDVFYRILKEHQLPEKDANLCADIFTNNSLDGVYTHGVNRFARFVKNIKEGVVQTAAEPIRLSSFGGLEQWNGLLGAGLVNATFATERAMHLAANHGIGCVALANTNHWMRGGTYGWQAVKKGFVFIGWTNTIANMPAWKAVDSRLGNSPIIIAIPYAEEAIVLDMAVSQFSFGALEQQAMNGDKLPVPGGYDKNGNLTHDPAAIIEGGRTLPVGYWKGSGLALLLDLLATILSSGLSTHQITRQGVEKGVSQVFVCIDLRHLINYESINNIIQNIIADYISSIPQSSEDKIRYPGERVLETRKRNNEKDIPVIKKVWDEVLALLK